MSVMMYAMCMRVLCMRVSCMCVLCMCVMCMSAMWSRDRDTSRAIRAKRHHHAAIHRTSGHERHGAVAVTVMEVISRIEVRVEGVVEPSEVCKVLAHHVAPACPVAISRLGGVGARAIGCLVHDVENSRVSEYRIPIGGTKWPMVAIGRREHAANDVEDGCVEVPPGTRLALHRSVSCTQSNRVTGAAGGK